MKKAGPRGVFTPDPPGPSCPVCGRRPERFYTDLAGAVLGCEYCVCSALWYELPGLPEA